MKKINRHILVFSILAFSFLLSRLLMKEAFISQTPRVNKNFIAKLKNLPSSTIVYLSRTLFPIKNPAGSFPQFAQIKQIYQTKTFIPLSKGVYAYEERGINYVKFNSNEINYRTIEITTRSGKVIKLNYPENNPPTKDMVDDIQSE